MMIMLEGSLSCHSGHILRRGSRFAVATGRAMGIFTTHIHSIYGDDGDGRAVAPTERPGKIVDRSIGCR